MIRNKTRNKLFESFFTRHQLRLEESMKVSSFFSLFFSRIGGMSYIKSLEISYSVSLLYKKKTTINMKYNDDISAFNRKKNMKTWKHWKKQDNRTNLLTNKNIFNQKQIFFITCKRLKKSILNKSIFLNVSFAENRKKQIKQAHLSKNNSNC